MLLISACVVFCWQKVFPSETHVNQSMQTHQLSSLYQLYSFESLKPEFHSQSILFPWAECSLEQLCVTSHKLKFTVSIFSQLKCRLHLISLLLRWLTQASSSLLSTHFLSFFILIYEKSFRSTFSCELSSSTRLVFRALKVARDVNGELFRHEALGEM